MYLGHFCPHQPPPLTSPPPAVKSVHFLPWVFLHLFGYFPARRLASAPPPHTEIAFYQTIALGPQQTPVWLWQKEARGGTYLLGDRLWEKKEGRLSYHALKAWGGGGISREGHFGGGPVFGRPMSYGI